MDGEERVQVGLTVIKSKIKSPGGIARVHSDILPHLELEKGESAEVFTGDKTILLMVSADNIIEKNQISLRQPDMERLGVQEGDTVYIRAHEAIGNVLGEWKEKIVSKFKKDKGDEDGE